MRAGCVVVVFEATVTAVVASGFGALVVVTGIDVCTTVGRVVAGTLDAGATEVGATVTTGIGRKTSAGATEVAVVVVVAGTSVVVEVVVSTTATGVAIGAALRILTPIRHDGLARETPCDPNEGHPEEGNVPISTRPSAVFAPLLSM